MSGKRSVRCANRSRKESDYNIVDLSESDWRLEDDAINEV